jgi:hypothetical protein
MKKDKNVVLLFILSIGGILFSGYLSGVKLFTEGCAFNESCPYFLGYPACYYGFVMFLLLTIFSYMLFFGKSTLSKGSKNMMLVSFLGILFAGYFTFRELPVLFEKGLSEYVLGLPTCALGLLFYLIIFFISYSVYKKNK